VIGPDSNTERQANAAEILALTQRLGNTNLAVFGHGYLAAALADADDIPGALAELEPAAHYAEQTKDPSAYEILNLLRSGFAAAEGRFDEADELQTAAFQRGQDAQDRNVVLLYLLSAGSLMLFRGRVDEIIGSALAALELYPGAAPALHAVIARAYVELGDTAGCRRHAEAVDLDDRASYDNVSKLVVLVNLAEAAALLGDQPRAAQLYEDLLPFERLNGGVPPFAFYGSVAMYLGVLAAALDRPDDAESHLRVAVARHERNQWPPLVGHAQVRLAAVLLASGTPAGVAEAAELAARALDTASQLGMAALARQARQLHDRATGAAPAPAVKTHRTPRRSDRTRARLTSAARGVLGRLSRDKDDDDILKRFGTAAAQRTLFTALAHSFQPSTSFGFQGEILFEVQFASRDANVLPSDWWTVAVHGSKASATRERAEKPAVTIRTGLPDLIRLISGELHPMRAVVEGRVHVDGDILVAARISDMFIGLSNEELVELVSRD
jgi:tetratricopeptide (TPR) repeat protein